MPLDCLGGGTWLKHDCSEAERAEMPPQSTLVGILLREPTRIDSMLPGEEKSYSKRIKTPLIQRRVR